MPWCVFYSWDGWGGWTLYYLYWVPAKLSGARGMSCWVLSYWDGWERVKTILSWLGPRRSWAELGVCLGECLVIAGILTGTPAKLSGAGGMSWWVSYHTGMVEKGENYIILIGSPAELSGAGGMPWWVSRHKWDGWVVWGLIRGPRRCWAEPGIMPWWVLYHDRDRVWRRLNYLDWGPGEAE